MRLVIDSSVFVAAFREQEQSSREAFELIKRVSSGSVTAIVPVIVIIEVMSAIRRRTGNEALARTIGETMLSWQSLSLIDITVFRMTSVLDIAATSTLSGMDAIIVGVAQEFDVPLVTLDKEILKNGSTFASVITPREFQKMM